MDGMTELQRAERRVETWQEHVARQRAIVRHLLATGRPDRDAEALLHTLEGSLQRHLDQRDILRTR